MRVLTHGVPRAATIALASAALLAGSGLESAPATAAPAGLHRSSALSPPSTAAPSATATRHRTSIRFLDFDHTRPWRLFAYVQGQVVGAKGGRRGALKGVRVKLYRKLDSQRRFHRLASGGTGTRPYPRFSFKTPAIGNATYKVAFRGNADYRPSGSTTRILVHRSMRSKLEDGSGSFHGFVRPKWNRKIVYLEKRACASCSYHKVRRTKSGPHGYFRFGVTAPRSGRWWWRASTPATSRFIWSYTSIHTTQLR